MKETAQGRGGVNRVHSAAGKVVSLPVVGAPSGKVRPSRMSRRRSAVLIGIHVLMILHIAHWLWTGRSVSPIEPSEAMYTLSYGHINAGFIFFVAALAATVVFGRFVCGWGCHLVAYQDLCAWLLKKVGIRPKPLRSRLLVLGPLLLAVYMFVWPTVYRWYVGDPAPTWTNHLMTTEFWKTFPGPVVAVLTLAICGFGIVFFLGSKGFCTYACPYGGFFGVVEKLSPGRIRVTDACKHCGHCTSACTSNVKIHEEVALYGMVVDPGCMKCMDCVTVCPNDALYFGFGKPSVAAKPASSRRTVSYDFTLTEEILMLAVGITSLLTFRGLYTQIPLLMAMGMAAITTYVFMKLVRLVRDANVRLQKWQLKRGGALTRWGLVFATLVVGWLMLCGHSGFIRYHQWLGHRLLVSLSLGDEVWSSESDWWGDATEGERQQADSALTALRRADEWGWMVTPPVLADAMLLELAKGDAAGAEATARRLIEHWPAKGKAYRSLALVLRKRQNLAEAQAAYRRALSHDPHLAVARRELAGVLASQNLIDEALDIYRAGDALSPDDPRWAVDMGQLLIRAGRFDEARALLVRAVDRRPHVASLYIPLSTACLQMDDSFAAMGYVQEAIALDPDLAEAHYNLGIALLNQRRIVEAIDSLALAVKLKADVALYHYNLGVATFMAGRPAHALPHIEEAIRLDPQDADANGFLTVLLGELPE